MIGYHISNHKTYDMSLVSELILTLDHYHVWVTLDPTLDICQTS